MYHCIKKNITNFVFLFSTCITRVLFRFSKIRQILQPCYIITIVPIQFHYLIFRILIGYTIVKSKCYLRSNKKI